MRVLVTGGTGFIGSHLCRELVEGGHEVLSLSRTRRLDLLGVQSCQADVASELARDFASGAEAIVHLAGLSDASLSRREPLAYATANAQGTLNMLEAARSRGAHFIFASSQRLYCPQREPLKEDDPRLPVDPYGYSKLVGETWVEMYGRLFGLPTTIVRFFSVYGPGQRMSSGGSGVVTIFVRRALAGQDLVIRGDVLRDFTFVSDATAGLRLALARPPRSGVFNVATGTATSVRDLAYLVKETTGATGAILEETGGDDASYVADVSLASEKLGYKPVVPLREGLRRYVDWLRENG